jgi:hypothetical protein
MTQDTSIPPMTDRIRQVQPEDAEIIQEWVRETDEDEVRRLGAYQVHNWQDEVTDWPGDGDGWLVGVDAMEFVRSEPLESELRQRIIAALRAVSGLTHVEERDREQWILTGITSGEALITSVAEVLDDLADRVRASFHD